jgi:hypothetical protein
MPDEQDKTNDAEIRELLRNIRDDQREILDMHKAADARWKAQTEELEKWQASHKRTRTSNCGGNRIANMLSTSRK